MAICGIIFNFTIMNTRPMLNCLPLTINLIVKLISELKIPIEGYLLLFQAIREIYPKIIEPLTIHKIQQIIAPLRTILSSDLPLLKYFNYPLLKEIVPFSKKAIAVGEDKPLTILEDEYNTKAYFPKQLLKNLPIPSINKLESYPGQAILQAEARSIIKMVTPITHEGIIKTKQKIKMKVKAGEGDLLFYRQPSSTREERMSLLFTGVGSHILTSHYSILETDAVKNKRSIAKVEEGFNKYILQTFDREHNLRN